MQFYFILIEPQYPENIGSAARAIKTMGFSKLRLINPCDHLSDPAKWLAHGSIDILENTEIFENFENAIIDLDFVIGTTSKNRKTNADYYNANDLLQVLNKKQNSIQSVGVVFGREDTGLNNSQLQRCDIISSIDMKCSYPSLNLAQSIMIYAYELNKRIDKISVDNKIDSSGTKYSLLKKKVQSVLLLAKIKKGSNLYNRIFERLAIVNDGDSNLIHSVCNKLLDK